MQVLILPAPVKIEEIKKDLGENIEIFRGRFSDIEFRFNCELRILHNGRDIKEYDFVWLSSLFGARDISRAISVYLDYHDVPHTKVNYGEGTSKLVDLTWFDLHKLPIPNSFFQNKCNKKEKVDLIADLCGFPVIVKDTQGSRGKNSHLIHSKEELVNILDKLPENKGFIFQQFIPNDYDWGILVSNGEVISAEKSYRSKSEFRNNACWGAKEVFQDIKDVSSEVKRIAVDACRLLDLEWGRADIVIDRVTSKPYLLEMNRFPGMTINSPEVKAFSSFLKNKLFSTQTA
ncbi:ATP-grasp domain-containing protein [Candidatus Dojkabacteria bacterium]|nr:ATP-grasp domain-containing protein [Candidatus Dojkabacteria bacterium]